MLVLFAGRPIVFTDEIKNADAILNVFFESEAGNAIAEVWFGDVNPSGKLTASFPQNVRQVKEVLQLDVAFNAVYNLIRLTHASQIKKPLKYSVA